MKKIIDSVLRNRLLVIVLGVFIIVGGYFSYKQLPIDAFPDVSPTLVRFVLLLRLLPEFSSNVFQLSMLNEYFRLEK